MLAVIQAIAACVAAVSAMSLQQAILQKYGRGTAIVAAIAVVVICLFTLSADVQAGAQALALLCGIPYQYFVVPLAGIAAWMLATKSYLKIERMLASFTLIFLCYLASAILARPNWSEVLHAILWPRFAFTPLFFTGAIALLGTTLTSYVYFWESIEVAERRPELWQLRAVSADAVLGMLVAGSSFLFILIATAATLGKHHVTIAAAADAAVALRPLAGRWDEALFGIGLFASAAIAIPVITATNGYVVAQTFRRPAGLALPPRDARFFYGVIYGSLALAAVLALFPIPTIAFLFWASVAAGIVTPLTLALAMLVARDRATMRGQPIGAPLACAGWLVTAIVAAASGGFLIVAARLL